MITFLLSKGINPNARSRMSLKTVWEQFLSEVPLNIAFLSGPDEFLQVVEKLLDSGADPHCSYASQSLAEMLDSYTGVTTKHCDRLRRILSAYGVPTHNTSQTETSYGSRDTWSDESDDISSDESDDESLV
jgi:hypothetical protein